jgi:RNA 2',3'-cyclic 3'-phosphodiesterase
LIEHGNRMPKQLSLTGFDAVPRWTDRLFFAIFPDVHAAARLEQLALNLRDEHGLKGRPLATERFHVTLQHLGDYEGLPQGLVAAAVDAAAAVAMPSFEVAFDRAVSFSGRPGNLPFVLRGGNGVAALLAFQQTLGRAIERAGLGVRGRSQYTPHLTLLYDDHPVVERPIETVHWKVREFVLVHSLLGRTVHVPLARWPLPN